MTAQIIPFNPLDKTNLGSSVADALLARTPVSLDELAEFQGVVGLNTRLGISGGRGVFWVGHSAGKVSRKGHG